MWFHAKRSSTFLFRFPWVKVQPLHCKWVFSHQDLVMTVGMIIFLIVHYKGCFVQESVCGIITLCSHKHTMHLHGTDLFVCSSHKKQIISWLNLKVLLLFIIWGVLRINKSKLNHCRNMQVSIQWCITGYLPCAHMSNRVKWLVVSVCICDQK